MRTPLSKVIGIGSAREGSFHFWNQRITAVAILPLGLLFIASIISIVGEPYEAVIAHFADPWISILTAGLIIAFAWHMKLGFQVIVEDYVHHKLLKMGILICNNLYCSFIVIAGLYALIRISLIG